MIKKAVGVNADVVIHKFVINLVNKVRMAIHFVKVKPIFSFLDVVLHRPSLLIARTISSGEATSNFVTKKE